MSGPVGIGAELPPSHASSREQSVEREECHVQGSPANCEGSKPRIISAMLGCSPALRYLWPILARGSSHLSSLTDPVFGAGFAFSQVRIDAVGTVVILLSSQDLLNTNDQIRAHTLAINLYLLYLAL